MKNSEKLFTSLGYNKRERYAGEEFVDNYSLGIYFHNNKLIQITNESDYVIELLPEEIQAMYEYCKEHNWIKSK